jgi:phosphinothricin acetyltransferase
MNVVFTDAQPTDLVRIVKTYNSTIASRLATADLEEVSVESKEAWFNLHSPKHRPLWVLLVENVYAGWMSFNSFYGRPAYDGTVEVSIYLEEDFRGKGIGKACVQKALEVAPELEIQNLLGFIFAHNIASLNLFYKYGFTDWARLPGVAKMDDQWRDLVIVGKKIG